MSSPVVVVENLSKRYRLGHQRSKGDGLRHALEDLARAPLNWIRSQRARKHEETEEFWALKDVSFEINRGEVVGIIGRNGAGKSTLLKILSRITEPTSGRIVIDGRVASLLEVGTGFHPELTGRENIFLNGAILGMSRNEIKRKFDEIVAFSEIEKFLDTPVKRYSSGMYVRLAFAVAAHLQPDILIVDEVLAVGDSEFQKKCLGKMQSVAHSGRTILFVSHNTAAVNTLCSRTILLNKGSIELAGNTASVLNQYLHTNSSSEFIAPDSHDLSPHIERVWFSGQAGDRKSIFTCGESISVNIHISNPSGDYLEVELAFFDGEGTKLWNFTHAEHQVPALFDKPTANIRITFCVPYLLVDHVYMHAGLKKANTHETYIEHITEGIKFSIHKPSDGGFRPNNSLLHCPVSFKLVTNDT